MQVYVLLVLCVLFWSANFVLGRFVAGAIDPWELVFFRWSGVLILTIPYFLLHVKRIVTALKMHFAILALLSFLGIACFNTLLYSGLHDTTATNALLINSSIPILILFFSFVILRTTISIRQVIGIILSTLGVIFLVLKGDIRTLYTLDFNSGDIWVIASSLCWAMYSVLIKFKPVMLSHFEFFVTTVFLGWVMLLPFYCMQGYTLHQEIALLSTYYWVIGYVVIFASIASYYMWHKGIVAIGASRTGQFTHLMPIFGSILAYFFLGERLAWYHLGGILLIGLGLYLCLFMKKSSQVS